jgi:hypothetical protein
MTVSTIKSSGGDYSSLTAWEAAQAATLTAPAEAECYDFSSSENLTITGITTSATNYLRIYGASANRLDGRSRNVSGTGFQITASSGNTINVAVNHCRFDGIEIEGTGTAHALTYQFGTFAAGANDHRVENSIVHDVLTGTGYTINASTSNLNITIRNNVIYGFQRTWDTRNAAVATSENNTTWRHADQLGLVSDSELTCKNTYAGKASGSAEDFWTGGAAPSGNNNASSDTSQATDYTAGVSSVSGSSVFTSVTSGSEDFRLLSGTNALVDAGATLTIATDIIGTSRPQGSAWDIGAFERIVAGGGSTPVPSVAVCGAGF